MNDVVVAGEAAAGRAPRGVALADEGEAGAVAALLALVMGMRANEIVSRVARDLDDDGKLLWIPDSKTEAGRRTLQVPELGMRGLHSTLAVEHGVSAHVVAASRGHESSATTIQSYVKPEAVSGAQQRRVMTVLEGARLTS